MENKDKHGLAINILKFQYFNFEFFNCQEIVLYETLMVLGGKSFTKRDEFFHSTKTLADKTGIKRHSVDRILIKFKKMGIIDYQIKGMPKVDSLQSATKATAHILQAVTEGEVDPVSAEIVSRITDRHIRSLQISDLEKRLQDLEDKLSNPPSPR